MELITSTLSALPETPDQIKYFAEKAKAELLNGQIDFRTLQYQKTCIERTLDAIFGDAEVKAFICGEVEKYGKEGCTFKDAKFEIASRKTWDYSKTNDAEIEVLEQKAKAAANDLKDRQKFLQTLSKPIEVLNNETGEVETIYPGTFSESTFIKTTFKK